MADTSERALPPEAWAPASRAARKLVSPIQRILAIEAASGLLLIAATVVALVWANSPWRAFPPGPLLDTAKLAILVGSGAACALGMIFGLLAARRGRP